MSPMLVQFIRDTHDQSKVIGCVVGLKQNGAIGVGVSLCSPRDKFDKKKAREIAEERAKQSINNEERSIPGNTVFYHNKRVGRVSTVPPNKLDTVMKSINEMKSRCERYYNKEKVNAIT